MRQTEQGRRYLEAIGQLPDIIQNLSHTRDIGSVMSIVRSAARSLVGADGAAFILRDADFCYYADEEAVSPLWKGQRFLMNRCISGWVMQNAQPAIIGDIYADERIPVDAYRTTFVKSMAMVPIRQTSPIGAIGTYWANLRQPTEEEIHILQALADATSIAMENIDLYDRLQKSLQLRERAVLDNIREGVITFNEDGMITGFNSACETVLGYHRFEVLGSNIAKIIPVIYAHAIKGEHTDQVEIITRKDGTSFAAEYSISEFMLDGQCCFSVILRDTSERIKAEAKLRESEERYELAVKGSNAGLWDWNIPANKLYWSDHFKAMLGIEDADFQPGYGEFKNRLHPEDRERITKKLEAHTRNQLPYDAEFRMRREDGSYLWVKASGASISDQNGRAIRMAGSLTDISARKHLEAELDEMKLKLEQSVTAKSQLIKDISDDLRSPLGSIMSSISAVLQNKEITEEQREKASHAWRTASKLLGVVDQMAVLTRSRK